MLPSFCADEVTVTRPGAAELRGTTVPDWRHPTMVATVSGCTVQPASTSEDRDGREATRLAATLYAPPGTDVAAGDRVAHGSDRYLVEGEPKVWRSPTGALAHVVCDLVVWRG